MKRKRIFTTENTESTEVDAVASVRSVVNTEDLPDGFQMTELGPLPKDWRVMRLGEVVERGILLMRNGFPQGQHNETGVGVPHLRPFNITNDGALDLSQIKFVAPPSDDDPHWLHPGDVIFNNTNSEELVGKTAFFNHDGRFVLSNHMTFLRVLEPGQIDPYWLARLLHLFWHLGMYRALCRRHVNQASISLERLKGVRMPLPPLPEQRAIAHVLRTVQRAKEATEGVIAALRELKKSLMQHLFTYGPVPVTERERVALQESEIGPLPAHWRVVRLGEVGKVITGKTPSTARPEYWNGHIPFITPVDLNGMPIRVAQRSITEDGLKKAKPLPKGAVLVSCIGYIGKVGVVDSEIAVTNQQINAVIVESSKISNWFLAYAVMRESNLLESRARKTTVPILHKTNFERIPIPLPPLPEQREIARILQAVDAKIAAEQVRRTALEELFKSLLHLLMTGKVRVKEDLGSQNANS
jgi:type I restriction enzyme S subunit